MRTLRMLEELVERHNEQPDAETQGRSQVTRRGQDDEIVLMAHDVGTEEGRETAQEFEVSTVPTTIVDGNRIIRGVPQSPEQVLEER